MILRVEPDGIVVKTESDHHYIIVCAEKTLAEVKALADRIGATLTGLVQGNYQTSKHLFAERLSDEDTERANEGF